MILVSRLSSSYFLSNIYFGFFWCITTLILNEGSIYFEKVACISVFSGTVWSRYGHINNGIILPKQLNPYLEGKIYSLTVESYNFLAGVRNTLRFTETDVTFPVINKIHRLLKFKLSFQNDYLKCLLSYDTKNHATTESCLMN